MVLHVVFGAGSVGTRLAGILASQGESVTLINRSGSGPDIPGVRRLAVDASDAVAVERAAAGASAIYNCLNPAYHRWAIDWPPMNAALIAAAESTGAVLGYTGNLYGYGHVDQPIRPDLPLAATTGKGRVRIQMWQDALAAHAAGRIRTFEVRGSDYIGDAGDQSMFGDRLFAALRARKPFTTIGNSDVLHSWTFTGDVALLLARLSANPDAWGRAWHVPTNPPRTQRQVVQDITAALGQPAPKVKSVPGFVLKSMGLVNPTMRELGEMLYEFTGPFVLDSSETTDHFDLPATPWQTIIEQVVQTNTAAGAVEVSR